MNENINLCEILKGLEGIELYSSIFGEVTLNKVSNNQFDYAIYILNSEGRLSTVTKEGKFFEGCGECILFPSKSQRDWSKFQRPIPIDTPMMCRNKTTLPWALYKYLGKIDGKHCVEYYSNSVSRGTANFNYMIPFDKFNPNDIEESLKYNIQK